MPIVERDPWREQYFVGVDCPGDIRIPTDDTDAYLWYPDHRWVYNKLLVCDTQGIAAAPHGIAPPRYPIFSKPIYNLRGMGVGSRVLASPEEYAQFQQPGHMWMTLLEGEHVSSDAAVVRGRPAWWRHSTGRALEGGIFDYWTVEAACRPDLEDYCGAWIRNHLNDYTGMLNFETIGGRVIESHLRFADQWPDLYGGGWVSSLVDLYVRGEWSFAAEPRQGYSVVLFGVHGPRYRHVDRRVVDDLLQRDEISSVQLTFHQDKPPEQHAMPPGGFRLAIVNCWDLDAGIEARARLAKHLLTPQKLRPRRQG